MHLDTLPLGIPLLAPCRSKACPTAFNLPLLGATC